MPETKPENMISSMLNVGRKLRQEFQCAGGPVSELTVAQMETLLYISEQKSVLMKTLADHLCITPPSATALANHLMDLDYIEREQDSVDKRASWLSLTKKGARVLDEVMKYRKQMLVKFMKRLDKKEQQQLFALMNKLTNTINH